MTAQPTTTISSPRQSITLWSISSVFGRDFLKRRKFRLYQTTQRRSESRSYGLIQGENGKEGKGGTLTSSPAIDHFHTPESMRTFRELCDETLVGKTPPKIDIAQTEREAFLWRK
jgi:hypothetical protein